MMNIVNLPPEILRIILRHLQHESGMLRTVCKTFKDVLDMDGQDAKKTETKYFFNSIIRYQTVCKYRRSHLGILNHMCVSYGKLSVVKHAIPYAKNPQFLYLAALRGSLSLTRYFCEHNKIKPTISSAEAAINSGSVSVLRYLLKHPDSRYDFCF